MSRTFPLAVISLCCLLSPTSAQEPAEPLPLRCQLLMMDALRKGDATPFDEVEKRGLKLLKEYTQPEQQARIYFQIAHVCAQSDIRGQSERVTKYAREALNLEKDPVQRGWLNCYLGCAARVNPAQESPTERRRQATRAYLDGYRELLALKLPDEAPELPTLNKVSDDVGATPGERAAEEARRNALMAARREAETQRQLIQRRDIFVRQIREMYDQPPPRGAELRRLVEQSLPDRKAADEFLARVYRK
jgi:hypothetical protein